MEFPEVIVTSDSVNQNNNCFIYDLKSGALIANFKEGNSVPKGLTFIKDDYLLSSLKGKPALKIWTMSTSQKEDKTMTVPGKVSALAVTSCGSYCIAAIEKSIYIWEVATGLLLAIICHHYQDITCLRFSCDGSHFISGGKDALVFVWNLSQQISIYDSVDDDLQKGKPCFSWNHHTAEVTDIFVTSLGTCSRVATASLDMTCRIYELNSGLLLLTVCMDIPITSVVIDPSEYFLILGGLFGKIFKINLFAYQEQELHYNELEEKCEVKAHGGKVTCLSVSQMGLQFLSGSEDKTLKLWDMRGFSCIKSFPHEGPVTNAFIAMKPLALIKEHIVPSFKVSVFSRQLVTEEDDDDYKFAIVKKPVAQKLSLRGKSIV